MKNNYTLNEINNNISLFWIKKLIILSFRFIGIFLEFFNKKDFSFKTKNNLKSSFFGYHDKKPFNFNDTKIIVHSYKSIKKVDDQSLKKLYIDLIDIKSKKIFNLDLTSAWSWQLGASLQWHPKKDIIFFNKKKKKKYITKKIDLNSNQTKKLNFSIYNMNLNGNKFLVADFIKIGKLRKGYGFETKKFQKISNLKKSKLMIINDKGKIFYLHSFDETKKNSVLGCYINHQTFSPNGNKVAYFYTILKKRSQRQIFFYYYCLKKKKNFLIKISRLNLISHYCWRNDNEILFTMKISKKKFSYVLYNTNTDKFTNVSSKLNKDGHPMFNPKNSDLFVSDTYPNLFGFQKLFIYSVKRDKIIWKRYIYSPYKFKGIIRCDLHPRWSNNGKKIMIDFVENENRNIGIFDI